MARNLKSTTDKPKMTESSGVYGYKSSGSYVYDEYVAELRGRMGRLKYREMADTDPVIGAILFGIECLVLATEFQFNPSEDDTTGEHAEWLEKTLCNMPSITFQQVIQDALSMLVYGFAVQEIVTMKLEDGSIGLKGLQPRAQDTITEWDIDKDGTVNAALQFPPNGPQRIYLPLWKVVHYKTTFARGNPEGRSMLRNAYQPYVLSQTAQISETIGIERELTGVPVLTAPGAWLDKDNNRATLERIARDLRLNDQSGVVMDSDPFYDSEGKPTNIPKFSISLLAVDSTGKIDTDKVIKRHQANMARTTLADFLMLGTDGKGSYSLSENKTSLFIRAVEGLLDNICTTLDRQLVDTLWSLNSFPPEMKPKISYGSLAPVDLQALGDYVAKITGAGAILNDLKTEDYLRSQAGLPPVPADRPEPINDPEPVDEGDEDPTADDNAGE